MGSNVFNSITRDARKAKQLQVQENYWIIALEFFHAWAICLLRTTPWFILFYFWHIAVFVYRSYHQKRLVFNQSAVQFFAAACIMNASFVLSFLLLDVNHRRKTIRFYEEIIQGNRKVKRFVLS